jgi:hypothetical protein
MRCPKCGYISFDHLTTCLNCSKDLSDHSSAAHGTTYNAVAPGFLKFPSRGDLREEDEDIEMMPEELGDDLDVVDPDLDILIKEDEQGIEFNPEESASEDLDGLDEDYSISLDDDAEEESEDREIEIDLSQFEDTSAEESGVGGQDEKFSMDLPDELSDISDLAPPPPPEEIIPSDGGKKGADEEMGMDMLDMDLNMDDLDTDFSLTTEEKEGAEEHFEGLSLDDIDLSDSSETEKPAPPTPPKSAPAAKPEEMDMDADLNFDLDLGGLTLPSKK